MFKPADIMSQQQAWALPAGWEAKVTPEGRTFYVNHSAQTTQWEHPLTKPIEKPKVVCSDGCLYFCFYCYCLFLSINDLNFCFLLFSRAMRAMPALLKILFPLMSVRCVASFANPLKSLHLLSLLLLPVLGPAIGAHF